ncbi:hypothetical protein [Streptomyces sp. NPDC001833]
MSAEPNEIENDEAEIQEDQLDDISGGGDRMDTDGLAGPAGM